MKTFTDFISEKIQRSIVITFGRFNPPHNGHLKLLNTVASVAKGGEYRIYSSQSVDPKKNPLPLADKIKFLRLMFPKHARQIVADADIKTSLGVLGKLYKQGYTEVTMVVGSDRIDEFQKLFDKYNGVKTSGEFFEFEGGVKVVSAGDRDPDAEGISGMSASKMRQAAADNDLASFAKGLPREFKNAQLLFNAVRKGMGLNESVNHRKHIQLLPVSDTREQYVQGSLFAVNDAVKILETNERGKITYCGSNYVIVETAESKFGRYWLSAVEKINEVAPPKSTGGWATEKFIEIYLERFKKQGKKLKGLVWISFDKDQKHERFTKKIDIETVLSNLDKLGQYKSGFKVFKNFNDEIVFEEIVSSFKLPHYHLI
jgi:hypothetical protein